MDISCSVCDRAEKATLKDRDLCLYKCGYCGHLFKVIAREDEEKYASEYYLDEHKNWFAFPNYRLFESIYKRIVKLKGGGKLKILDIGCGKGDFLKYLRKRNPELELYGIDLSDNFSPGINFIKGDIINEDFNHKFDVICNIAVLEHTNSPVRFMNKIHESLFPEGICFTVTVNADGLIYKIAEIVKKGGVAFAYRRLHSRHHLQFFSRKSLRTLMEKTGFSLISQRNHNHPIRAVDYPRAGILVTVLNVTAVYLIFGLSGALNNGILQTSIDRKA